MRREIIIPIMTACAVAALSSNFGAERAGEEERLFQGNWESFQKTDAAREEIAPAKLRTNVLAAAVLHATNEQRKEHGLEALRFHAGARKAAALQARIMRERGSISHENPDQADLRTLRDRAEAAGLEYRFIAENVATIFGLQYEPGKPFYTRQEGARTVFSYEPRGEAIPRHTYATFAEALVGNWMKSPGHRKNILSDSATHMGASAFPEMNAGGMTKFYAAQVFFRPLH